MCQGNNILGNTAMYICVLKKTLNLTAILFKDEISLRTLYLSDMVGWSPGPCETDQILLSQLHNCLSV